MKSFSKLKAEIRRHWRGRYRNEFEMQGREIPSDFQEQEPDDGELQPPEAKRVATRACCLAAVALRGLVDTWEHEEQREFIPQFERWLSTAGLDDELEDTEREVFHAPASKLDERSAINACWRWEGAAVLAASLGRIAIPPHDETVDTQECGDACGLFVPRVELDRLIMNATFDPNFDRFAYANRVLAIDWRLRQFQHIEQKSLDFAAFAQGVQWATFDLRGVPLCEGDLAISGCPIISANADALRKTMSIASERHIAANWLIGWSSVYSEVETPT